MRATAYLPACPFRLLCFCVTLLEGTHRSLSKITSKATEFPRLNDIYAYNTLDMHGNIRLSPGSGLTPILQSWYVTDLDMVTRYVKKGVSAPAPKIIQEFAVASTYTQHECIPRRLLLRQRRLCQHRFCLDF